MILKLDRQPRLKLVPTRGELIWVWRKRHRFSVLDAARHLKIDRFVYVQAEHDQCVTDLDLSNITPTLPEVLRLYRRRSKLLRDELADKIGISHVTYLKWERRGHPAIVKFWAEG